MDLDPKRRPDGDHFDARSLKLQEESQALIEKLRELREESLALRQYSKSIRDSLKVFISRRPKS